MSDSNFIQHQVIARVRSPYVEKFGVPRQSGLVPAARGEIIFEPPFNQIEAFGGITEFSHLWLIFEFHLATRDGWKATVRPPRLGGNERRGVFATRSPFRPNALGLSVVALEGVDLDGVDGPKLIVGGLDLVDGTPIYDIKPYLPYADSIPRAAAGFASEAPFQALEVEIDVSCKATWETLSEEQRLVIGDSLRLDPRPAFQKSDRVYRLSLASCEIACRISEGHCVIVELKCQ